MAKKVTKTKSSAVTRQTHELDAVNQAPGRLATQIARLLQGKNKATYQPHVDSGDYVTVSGASQLRFSGQKAVQKKYHHYSGYPGGLKSIAAKDLLATKPADVLKKAVWNMLPKNKLRAEMIKRLKISN